MRGTNSPRKDCYKEFPPLISLGEYIYIYNTHIYIYIQIYIYIYIYIHIYTFIRPKAIKVKYKHDGTNEEVNIKTRY